MERENSRKKINPRERSVASKFTIQGNRVKTLNGEKVSKYRIDEKNGKKIIVLYDATDTYLKMILFYSCDALSLAYKREITNKLERKRLILNYEAIPFSLLTLRNVNVFMEQFTFRQTREFAFFNEMKVRKRELSRSSRIPDVILSLRNKRFFDVRVLMPRLACEYDELKYEYVSINPRRKRRIQQTEKDNTWADAIQTLQSLERDPQILVYEEARDVSPILSISDYLNDKRTTLFTFDNISSFPKSLMASAKLFKSVRNRFAESEIDVPTRDDQPTVLITDATPILKESQEIQETRQFKHEKIYDESCHLESELNEISTFLKNNQDLLYILCNFTQEQLYDVAFSLCKAIIKQNVPIKTIYFWNDGDVAQFQRVCSNGNTHVVDMMNKMMKVDNLEGSNIIGVQLDSACICLGSEFDESFLQECYKLQESLNNTRNTYYRFLCRVDLKNGLIDIRGYIKESTLRIGENSFHLITDTNPSVTVYSNDRPQTRKMNLDKLYREKNDKIIYAYLIQNVRQLLDLHSTFKKIPNIQLLVHTSPSLHNLLIQIQKFDHTNLHGVILHQLAQDKKEIELYKTIGTATMADGTVTNFYIEGDLADNVDQVIFNSLRKARINAGKPDNGEQVSFLQYAIILKSQNQNFEFKIQ